MVLTVGGTKSECAVPDYTLINLARNFQTEFLSRILAYRQETNNTYKNALKQVRSGNVL